MKLKFSKKPDKKVIDLGRVEKNVKNKAVNFNLHG